MNLLHAYHYGLSVEQNRYVRAGFFFQSYEYFIIAFYVIPPFLSEAWRDAQRHAGPHHHPWKVG